MVPLAADTTITTVKRTTIVPLVFVPVCGSFCFVGAETSPPRQQLTIIEEVPLLPDQSCEYFYLSCVFPALRSGLNLSFFICLVSALPGGAQGGWLQLSVIGHSGVLLFYSQYLSLNSTWHFTI